MIPVLVTDLNLAFISTHSWRVWDEFCEKFKGMCSLRWIMYLVQVKDLDFSTYSRMVWFEMSFVTCCVKFGLLKRSRAVIWKEPNETDEFVGWVSFRNCFWKDGEISTWKIYFFSGWWKNKLGFCLDLDHRLPTLYSKHLQCVPEISWSKTTKF